LSSGARFEFISSLLLQYQHVTSLLMELRTLLGNSRTRVQYFLKTKLSACFPNAHAPPHLLSSSHGDVGWYQQQQIQWFYCNEFQGSSPFSFNSTSTSISFFPTVVLFSLLAKCMVMLPQILVQCFVTSLLLFITIISFVSLFIPLHLRFGYNGMIASCFSPSLTRGHIFSFLKPLSFDRGVEYYGP
jgi:hypothetical protein